MAKNVNKEVKVENTDIIVAGVKCVEYVGNYGVGTKTERVPMDNILNCKVLTENGVPFNTQLEFKGSIKTSFNPVKVDEVNFVNNCIFEKDGKYLKLICLTNYKWGRKDETDTTSKECNVKQLNESCHVGICDKEGNIVKWVCANVNGGTAILTIRYLFQYDKQKGYNLVNNKYVKCMGRNDSIKTIAPKIEVTTEDIANIWNM